MLLNLLRLHRILHLFCRRARRRESIWSQPSRCHSWSFNLCRWLRSWAHVVVSYVGNTSNWKEFRVYSNSDRFRLSPIRRHLRQKLRDAFGFQVLDWILRIPCISYRRCYTCGHVQAFQKSLCNRNSKSAFLGPKSQNKVGLKY